MRERDIATARQADRPTGRCVQRKCARSAWAARLGGVAPRAHAPRIFALARLGRRLEIVGQFRRTTVQEVTA
jgi:hypothetical protein